MALMRALKWAPTWYVSADFPTFISYPDLIQRLAIKGISGVSWDISSGGSFQSSQWGHSNGTLENLWEVLCILSSPDRLWYMMHDGSKWKPFHFNTHGMPLPVELQFSMLFDPWTLFDSLCHFWALTSFLDGHHLLLLLELEANGLEAVHSASMASQSGSDIRTASNAPALQATFCLHAFCEQIAAKLYGI